MKDKIILEETSGACLTLILNRPKAHNAVNFELAEALSHGLEKAASRETVRVVLLRGAGEAFSAGGDLKLFEKNLATSDRAFNKISTYLNEAIHHITTMPKPVVAAVRGPAYAAGFGLAISCDIVAASQDSKFSPSFANLALSPNAASTFFLPRILGPRLAAEAFFTGRVFSAAEARDFGLINHAWPEETFEEELALLTKNLAARPTATLGRIKKLLRTTFAQSFQEQLDMEKEEIAASSLSEDFKEGLKAFLEKRVAKFKGK